jgi:hypothetical protein
MKFGVRKNIEYRARSDKGETKKGGKEARRFCGEFSGCSLNGN